MKKFLLIVFTAFLFLGENKALASESMNCQFCNMMLMVMVGACNGGAASCYEEDIVRAFNNIASALPTSVKSSYIAFMEAYDETMISVFDPDDLDAAGNICYQLIGCSPINVGDGAACGSCTDCDSTNWSALRTGYQSRISRSCACGICVETTQYRCATGYYGSSSNGTSGCSRCPSSGGIYGTSDLGNNKVQTKCYLPIGTSVTDSYGTYTTINKCYYE